MRKEAAAEQSGKKRTFAKAVTARIKSVVNNEKTPAESNKGIPKKSAVVGEAKPTAKRRPWGTKKNADAPRQNTDENIIIQIPRTAQKNGRKVTFQNQAQQKNFLEEG